MWSFHDDIRAIIKDVRATIEAKEFDSIIEKISNLYNNLSSFNKRRREYTSPKCFTTPKRGGLGRVFMKVIVRLDGCL